MGSELNIGFLPLTDAAALIAAADFGFAQSEGVTIRLHRDVSWANLRDKLMVGHYDAAHLLAPLALAATLGVGQAKCPLLAPFLLNLNGNGITASLRLADEMATLGLDPLSDWLSAARAVGAVVRARREQGRDPLTFATVHLFSTHTYLLRHFLKAGDVDPDRDVEIVVAPPSFLVDFMDRGLIDAFCVGSPWNSIAVDSRKGVLLALGCEVLAEAPEKVLAMPEQGRLARDPDGLALLRALAAASDWVGDAAHHHELAAVMARPDRLDCPAALVERTLSGQLVLDATGRRRDHADFIRFAGPGLHRPDRYVGWLLDEMVAAGQVQDSEVLRTAASGVFSAKLYAEAGL